MAEKAAVARLPGFGSWSAMVRDDWDERVWFKPFEHEPRADFAELQCDGNFGFSVTYNNADTECGVSRGRERFSLRFRRSEKVDTGPYRAARQNPLPLSAMKLP